MKKMRTSLRQLFVLAPLLGGSWDVEPLERALTDAVVRADEKAKVTARAEVEEYAAAHPDVSRVHYLLGLAELTDVTRTNAAPDRSDIARTVAALDRAQEHFARAHELDAADADACAAYALCILQRFVLGEAGPDQGQVLMEWVGRGKSAPGAHASVELLDLWVSTSSSATSPQAADDVSRRFYELAERVRGRVTEAGREPTYFELLAQVMSARALIFSSRPQPRRAAELVDAMLETSPDLVMARRFLLPFVTVREPMPAALWSEREWTELGVEVDVDGRSPGLADGACVSYARTEDELWLRVELQAPPDTELFGLNVVIDADASDQTGANWWGGNTDFTFDRLVSAWVARDDEDRYRGALGVTDVEGAFNGEMTNLGDDVGFAVDVEGQAFVLRVPWGHFGEGDSARFVVAVGSNSNWNDDLPDAGSFSVTR